MGHSREVTRVFSTCAAAARAAGMLHDTFEVLTAVYRHGGKDAMFQFFAAFCAGMVLDDLADYSPTSSRT